MRAKRAWLAMALLAGSWMLGMKYYHGPRPALWALMVAAGVALMWGTVRRRVGSTVAAVALVLTIPAVVLARWPYRIGPLLLAVGLALQLLPVPRRWLGRLGSAAVTAGVVLTAQALAIVGYIGLTARSHELPMFLARALGGVFRLLGMDVAVDGTNLALFTMRKVHPLGATWELLLDPPSLCFILGGLVLLALWAWSAGPRRASVRPWVVAAGLWVLSAGPWLLLRAGLLAGLFLHRALRTDYDAPLNLMNQFWSPWVLLGGLSGLVLLAWRFASPAPLAGGADGTEAMPADGAGAARRGHRPGSKAWHRGAAVALSFAAVGALTLAALWDPVGRRKAGRVLVDEYHSQKPWPGEFFNVKQFDTTRTDRPFDRNWYGHASAYNLYCLYDYCSRFYEMSRQMEPLTAEALADKDVLVLKVPSAPFTPDERRAVLEFVRAGGGLMLLGEHTSVYGSGVYLNQLAREFGFRFRYDCLFGIDSFFEQRYVPPVAPHPIIQRMGPLDFAISCSIDPGFSAGRAVIVDTGLKNLGADYHATNFYPQTKDLAQMRYGAFVQLWATRYGKGRVVAFTDSTIFANFSAFEPGKSELMLGILEWLNRSGGSGRVRLWLLLVGLALGAGALLLAWSGGASWLLMLAAASLGWSASTFGVAWFNRRAMPMPPPRPGKAGRMVRVGLDRAVSKAPLPRNGFIGGKDDAFGLFERNILRLGYFPFRTAKVGELARADLVVVLHPSRPVRPDYRDRLAEYVRAGGRLLVLDSPANKDSTANELLQPFGLVVRHQATLKAGELAVPKALAMPAIPVTEACEVLGGVPLVRLAGRPVAAVARLGDGAVIVLGFGTRFVDANMGVVGDVVPDERLRKVYDFEFELLEAIVGDRLPLAASLPAPAPSR